eukprot:47947_1
MSNNPTDFQPEGANEGANAPLIQPSAPSPAYAVPSAPQQQYGAAQQPTPQQYQQQPPPQQYQQQAQPQVVYAQQFKAPPQQPQQQQVVVIPQQPQQPQQGYLPPQQATTTVIVTQPAPINSTRVTSRLPQLAYCPRCQQMRQTKVYYTPGLGTWAAVGGCCLVGCWLCCCIPFCIDDLKDAEHSCTVCGTHVGSLKMLR